MSDLDIASIAIIVLTSLLVGVSKTGMPGVGILLTPIMAMAFPAKLSVGQLLPLLIVGDLFAVAHYRRHARLPDLAKLCPGVIGGMLLGWLALSQLDNDTMQPTLGILVLTLLGIEILRRRGVNEAMPKRKWFAFLVGAAAGCATTVGNAAGPIMSIYLVMMGLDKKQLLGTAAWFFMAVNLTKLPIFFHQGMLSLSALETALPMTLFVIIGTFVGRRLLALFSQRWFDRTVLSLATLSAIWLLVTWFLPR